MAEFGGDEHFRAVVGPARRLREELLVRRRRAVGRVLDAGAGRAAAAAVAGRWRSAAALVFGAAVGVLRMAAGAHFFTDVVFAGVFAFLVIWLDARLALPLAADAHHR